MKKIDCHHHLIEENNYLDRLLRKMDRCGIEQSALIGLGTEFSGLFVREKSTVPVADNHAVEQACRRYPDRFFGLGYLRLGEDPPALADELAGRGFRGLKFHVPRDRYDSDAFFPVYERAAALGLPCLFHTGITHPPHPLPGRVIRSHYMDCIYLEPVAQAFPELRIIIAHLGIQDYLTALTLIRLFGNIHADLSGSTPGWRANIGAEEWRRYLSFPGADRKILFGTDVHCDELEQNIGIYDSIAGAAGWSPEQKQNMFHANCKALFQL